MIGILVKLQPQTTFCEWLMRLLHFHFKNQNSSLKGNLQNMNFALVPRWVAGQSPRLPWWSRHLCCHTRLRRGTQRIVRSGTSELGYQGRQVVQITCECRGVDQVKRLWWMRLMPRNLHLDKTEGREPRAEVSFLGSGQQPPPTS